MIIILCMEHLVLSARQIKQMFPEDLSTWRRKSKLLSKAQDRETWRWDRLAQAPELPPALHLLPPRYPGRSQFSGAQ